MQFPFKEIICDMCGRTFIPAVSHIYKETRKGKIHWFCKYSCQCAFNRKYPKVKGSRWKKNESELYTEND